MRHLIKIIGLIRRFLALYMLLFNSVRKMLSTVENEIISISDHMIESSVSLFIRER